MKHLLRAAMIALAIAGTSALATAHEVKTGDLLLTHLWSRATPGGAKVAGGYLTITNNGSAPDRLVSATSPASGRTEVHEMATTNGVMTMRPLEQGIVIAPGASVTLAPGGLHLMLTDLRQPLKEGEMLPVRLTFEKAGAVDVALHIRGVGAQAPDAARKPEAGHPGMKM